MPASVAMVIAPDQFRDEEYAHPAEVLQDRGASVATVSLRTGACTGRFGLVVQATRELRDVTADEFDAVVFVGGGGSAVYFDDPLAHALARESFALGHVVAAICIAPSTLARAGLLQGRRATAFPSRETDLREHGASWTGAPVEVDGLIVTANGPEAARDFGSAIADLLGLD